MHTIGVIPILKSAPPGTLTYFAALPILPGSVVSISVRNKKVPAIVVESTPVELQKSSLKRGSFKLKKLGVEKPLMPFQPEFLKMCIALSQSRSIGVGSVLQALLPLSLLPKLPNVTQHGPNDQRKLKNQIHALEASDSERIEIYQSTIRSMFARGKSVYVIAPTIHETQILYDTLKKGIEHRSFLLVHEGPPKNVVESWKKATTGEESVLVCMTYSFLALPRTDLGCVIVEREGARTYQLPARPHLNIGEVVDFLSQEHNALVIYADRTLSVSTRAKVMSGLYESHDHLRPVLPLGRTTWTVLDTREKKEGQNRRFTPIHPELEKKIEEYLRLGRSVAILTGRRGYATTVVCSDCSERVSCHTCTNTIALETKDRTRMFVCRRCGTTRSAKETCTHCGSWKLVELGIGIERVYEHLEKRWSKSQIFRLDADIAKNRKDALALYTAWREKPNSILVGTERMLVYLREPVSLGAVITLDTLAASPEWQAYEHTFALLRSFASKCSEILIETRRPDDPLITRAIAGDVQSFADEELAIRRQFSYPPFATIILFSVRGTPSRVDREMSALQDMLKEWNPVSGGVRMEESMRIASLILKIPNSRYFERSLPERLTQVLRTLPPYIAVEFDPPSLRV